MVTSSLKLIGDKYEFDFEDFEKQIVEHKVKMYILINPQNPSGRVFTKQELLTMGEICLKHNVLIVSDEIHANTVYSGHKHIPICKVSPQIEDNSIMLCSPSKAFNIQGLTYAVVVIKNKKLNDEFEIARAGYDFNFATNLFSIVATQAAYSECEKWLSDCIDYLEDNLNYMEKFIKDNIPEIKLIRPEGAYMAWLDFRSFGKTSQELYDLLFNKYKLALTFGETFGTDGEGFERINFACHRSTLQQALDRLLKMVEYIKSS